MSARFLPPNHKAPDWGDLSGTYGGKFKSILSRTPLTDTSDIQVRGKGWSPASVVRAETEVAGRSISLYSLHLPGRGKWEGSTHASLAKVLLEMNATGDVIVAGDFNEPTEGPVMAGLLDACGLTNTSENNSIDHILYRSSSGFRSDTVSLDWGPKAPARDTKPPRQNPGGYLSDHPWVSVDFTLSAQ